MCMKVRINVQKPPIPYHQHLTGYAYFKMGGNTHEPQRKFSFLCVCVSVCGACSGDMIQFLIFWLFYDTEKRLQLPQTSVESEHKN